MRRIGTAAWIQRLGRVTLAGLAVLCICAQIPADEATLKFDAANKLYEQGKYAEAVTEYQKLLEAGRSPALLFNLGNAYLKSGQLGRAIAIYRYAEMLAPRDPDLQANLRFARSQVQGPALQDPRMALWLRRLTLNEWTLLAFGAVWLFLLLLAVTQVRPVWRSSLRPWKFLIGTTALILSAGLAAGWRNATLPRAIVVLPDAQVKQGPFEESQTLFTVHDGAELAVMDSKDDWLRVSSDGRRAGWVNKRQVLVRNRA